MKKPLHPPPIAPRTKNSVYEELLPFTALPVTEYEVATREKPYKKKYPKQGDPNRPQRQELDVKRAMTWSSPDVHVEALSKPMYPEEAEMDVSMMAKQIKEIQETMAKIVKQVDEVQTKQLHFETELNAFRSTREAPMIHSAMSPAQVRPIHNVTVMCTYTVVRYSSIRAPL